MACHKQLAGCRGVTGHPAAAHPPFAAAAHPPPGGNRHNSNCDHGLPLDPRAGYARVAAAVYAFAVALHSPGATVLAYFASFVCDELDGRFARKFNQCSTLGSGVHRGRFAKCLACLLARAAVLAQAALVSRASV